LFKEIRRVEESEDFSEVKSGNLSVGENQYEEEFINEAYENYVIEENNEQIDKFVTEFKKIKEDNDQEERIVYNKDFEAFFSSRKSPKNDHSVLNASSSLAMIRNLLNNGIYPVSCTIKLIIHLQYLLL
jgi:hypothetical protein